MTANTLLPCPFCGSPADFCHTDVFWVRCKNDNCSAETHCGEKGTKPEAIKIWNRRTAPEVEYIDTPEDIEIKGEEILCWDGCEWLIDYVELDVDSGCYYMANGTHTEAYLPMPQKLHD
ncbi:Lar family restriction alleviation protein [Vibrio hannami]|uniref:Lar family restriction alleviation protein n=1 Tax=Vibrio hannami TaxID=2717094 RepID=UPI00240F471A|nr:Lar family restriction alleviation protein [Vibrio hannami]MDG3089148.1 Lar family restriction alleviation protein [Vibrio hannami]